QKERKEEEIGKIIHYYDKIGVAIIEIGKAGLAVGDVIHIKGHTDDFDQKVESMEVEHSEVLEAKKGDVIGLKIEQKVHEGGKVYKAQE
ncbi:MAG: translation elongation factor-like protein, partial [bacterium]|nr:translation elongation factor-like protein [bacterium]